MRSTEEKLVTPGSLLLDIVLMVAFFAFLYSVIVSHVPTRDVFWRTFWGAACTSCLTAVFWLCIQMFRVVLKAQIRLNRERAGK